jgi:hypothetical protein
MKTYNLFLLGILSTLIVLDSCKKDTTYSDLAIHYLPLAVGNSWKLEHSVLREIKGKTTIDGKEYLLMVTGTDSTYYRTDGDNIWVKRIGSTESLMFKLNVSTGDSWNLSDDSENGYTVTLKSKTDTIFINNHAIPNCYRYFFDIPMAVDDEHSVTLAPGIGFIEENCGFCAYPKNQLQYAKIDGNQITF